MNKRTLRTFCKNKQDTLLAILSLNKYGSLLFEPEQAHITWIFYYTRNVRHFLAKQGLNVASMNYHLCFCTYRIIAVICWPF